MTIARQIISGIASFASAGLIGLARFYQLALSPLLGMHCRYLPTCSEYFIQSIKQRGPILGTLAGIWRICRCHPLAKGGYNPVPTPKNSPSQE